jgi:hypothetical protein
VFSPSYIIKIPESSKRQSIGKKVRKSIEKKKREKKKEKEKL